MAFLQPGHIMDCGVLSRLDATMIAVDRFMPADLCIPKAVGFLLGDENLNILSKCALVALERQDLVGLHLEDCLGDVPLTPYRVDRHNRTLDGQLSRSAGIATISLDFSATLTCPNTRRCRAANAETMWIGAPVHVPPTKGR